MASLFLLFVSSFLPVGSLSPLEAKPLEIPLFSGSAVSESAWRQSGLAPEEVGFLLYDIDKGEVVVAHNQRRTFIPASTLKLPTVVAALDRLGPGFRFNTTIAHSGVIRDGVLHGNLYLRGEGDPILSYNDLLTLVEKLRERGIRRVEGRFLYDHSAFAEVRQIDTVMEEDASYNPGLSALNLDYNTIQGVWSFNRRSGNSTFRISPDFEQFRAVTGRTPTLSELDLFYSGEVDGQEEWGLVARPATTSGRTNLPVKDSGRFTALGLRRIAAMHGITLPMPESGRLPLVHGLIHRHQSRELIDISRETLHFSNNLLAEMLLLSLARSLDGQRRHTLSEAGAILVDYYRTRMPGVEWSGIELANGSGLSSRTRISPEQMVAMTLYADTLRFGDRSISSLLPASGGSWSLRRRFDRPDQALRVWAKTGSIFYANGLSGFLYTKSGRRMAFAFFTSNLSARSDYEKNSERRTRAVQQEVGNWSWRSRAFMDRTIADWIERY